MDTPILTIMILFLRGIEIIGKAGLLLLVCVTLVICAYFVYQLCIKILDNIFIKVEDE